MRACSCLRHALGGPPAPLPGTGQPSLGGPGASATDGGQHHPNDSDLDDDLRLQLQDYQVQERSEDYQVHVDSFEVALGRSFVIYTMTVSRGDTRWPIRRRYNEVATLHRHLVQVLGRSSMREGLPRLPPKVTCRQLVFGQRNEHFLAARASQLQAYLGAVVRHIPHVDQCEPLCEFLCSPDMTSMGYEALLDLAEAVGNAPTSDAQVAKSEIEALPRRGCPVESDIAVAPAATASRCPICQEELEADGDVRVLPCGHEYHFRCIAQWIQLKNRCCVCLCTAVPRPAQEQPPAKDL